MRRILIGSALVILCAAVAAAQNPPLPSPTGSPGVIGPVQKSPTGIIAPDFKPLTTPQTVNPSIKKGTPSIAPGGIAPATLPTPSLQTQSLCASEWHRDQRYVRPQYKQLQDPAC